MKAKPKKTSWIGFYIWLAIYFIALVLLAFVFEVDQDWWVFFCMAYPLLSIGLAPVNSKDFENPDIIKRFKNPDQRQTRSPHPIIRLTQWDDRFFKD